MFSLKKEYTNLVFVFLQSLSWRHDLTDKIRSPTLSKATWRVAKTENSGLLPKPI